MLVLKLSLQEQIYIDGGAITLMLTDARDGCAKIGITAPRSVSIVREELMPDGPTRCCKCGGTFPPRGIAGERLAGGNGICGNSDSDSGKPCTCAIGFASVGPSAGPESKDGAA